MESKHCMWVQIYGCGIDMFSISMLFHIWVSCNFSDRCLCNRLGFLEAEAFEDGILERYPTFLSIVLNHVSDDTPEFSCAVTCLKASFEMLGGFSVFPVSHLSDKKNVLFYFGFLFLQDANFGWELHYHQVWCAIHYWVSASTLEMRKATKIYLIYSSLFCRHV